MRIDIITIFPELFIPFLQKGIIGKAREKAAVQIVTHDLRNFTTDRHRMVDDYPYGGGPGMVLKPEPIWRAVKEVAEEGRVVFLTPQGRTFDQDKAWELSQLKNIILICGRYEGVDERVREELVDEELSIGDYVLNGGEVPAMAVVEAVVRLRPEVLGDEDSAVGDSFYQGLLDHPHYTRPEEFAGRRVPPVLLSGDHKRIDRWRKKERLRQTIIKRPDLLQEAQLSPEEQDLLEQVKTEIRDGLDGKEDSNERY